MRIIDCAQNTPEWLAARRGIPTASCFDKIITPAKGELSKSSKAYAYKLLAEKLLNAPVEDGPKSVWMERGNDLESAAATQYGFVNDVDLERVGFITTDDGLIGASPDRLIRGKSAGLEIKVPAPHTHLQYLLDGPGADYRVQVQGQNYVCEFDYVDFYSYSDRMPHCTIRTARDEPFIKLMVSALNAFNEQMADMEERARAMGLFQAYAEAETGEAGAIDQAFRTEVLAEAHAE